MFCFVKSQFQVCKKRHSVLIIHFINFLGCCCCEALLAVSHLLLSFHSMCMKYGIISHVFVVCLIFWQTSREAFTECKRTTYCQTRVRKMQVCIYFFIAEMLKNCKAPDFMHFYLLAFSSSSYFSVSFWSHTEDFSFFCFFLNSKSQHPWAVWVPCLL